MNLRTLKKNLEEEVQGALERMDQLIHSQHIDNEIENAFMEEEGIIERALADFHEALDNQSDELRLLAEDTRLLYKREINKRRAVLLTNWYRYQAEFLREALPFDFERLFAGDAVRKNILLFHTAMKKLEEAGISTTGLKGTPLYQAMLAKGKLLEIKENLILAFTEYEEILVDEYAKGHTTGHLSELRSLFGRREELCHEIERAGKALYSEGISLERDAGELMQGDLSHYGELFKQGNHLAEVGKQLQKKALLAEEKLRMLRQRPHH